MNWEELGVTYGILPEEWEFVTELGATPETYDWMELNAFYSAEEGKFYWRGESGCCCYYWGEGVEGVDDFDSGDAEELMYALREFQGEFKALLAQADLDEALNDVLTWVQERQHVQIEVRGVLCGCCTVLLANGDTSGCEYNCGDDHVNRLCEFGLEAGETAVVGSVSGDSGCFRCAGCGDDSFGYPANLVVVTR